MRHPAAFILVAGLAAAGPVASRPAAAQEPTRSAVMGVRLYVSAPEVLAVLYAQGVAAGSIIEHSHPCFLHSVATCTDTITARLPDGPIVVRFTDAPPGFNDGREAAYSISYTIPGRGPSDGTMVRSAAEDHYGLPANQLGVWCAHAPAKAVSKSCPGDAPRLAFVPGPDQAGALILTDLGLPARLGVPFTAGAGPDADTVPGGTPPTKTN